jgi:hypothetical protein
MSAPLSPQGNAALTIADYGLSVFRLWGIRNGHCACPKGRACTRPGKHPRFEGWQAAATSDPDQIVRRWRATPYANIGIACGKSRLLVVDVDPERHGDDELRALTEQYGPLPHTPIALTGGGGEHYYLGSPGGITNHSPFTGIDIRGDGGFVVAPGSIHVSGRTYEWEASSHLADTPIAPAPRWFLDRLRRASGGEKPADAIAPRIPEGQRHRTLVSFAGSLRYRGLTADELTQCLAVINESRCDPALSPEELRSIADSVAKYDTGEPTMPDDWTPGEWLPGEERWIVVRGDA